MIKRADFDSIDKEVYDSVVELYDFLFKTCRQHIYILLLAEGEFKPELLDTNPDPYVIDNKTDIINDGHRLDFLMKFQQNAYKFPTGINQIEDDEFRFHIELMIYSHNWESRYFLKKLFKLATCASGGDYLWTVTVPDWTKHEFIRNEIRDVFKKKKLSIAETITKGYHSSVRNAFAHSEYRFDDYHHRIDLLNFKGDTSWELKSISYDDWSKRYLYSVFLTYHLHNVSYEKCDSLSSDFGQDTFLIVKPFNEGKSFRCEPIKVQKIGTDRISFHHI
jgi:hypothetical protein